MKETVPISIAGLVIDEMIKANDVMVLSGIARLTDKELLPKNAQGVAAFSYVHEYAVFGML